MLRPRLRRLVQERLTHRFTVVTAASAEADGADEAGDDEGDVDGAEEEEGEQVCREPAALSTTHPLMEQCQRTAAESQ
jgi:hypothetical protein